MRSSPAQKKDNPHDHVPLLAKGKQSMHEKKG
jgi:hypothetical protein